MTTLDEALRGGPAGRPRAPAKAPVLLLGGAGALGSAVLERLLVDAPVEVAVTGPLATALQGLRPLSFDAESAAPLATQARLAVVVFDAPRHVNGRERSFFLPVPGQLPEIARRLETSGVRDLLIVLPHAPTRLPQALKTGLATLDEHAAASLAFEHVLIVRPTRHVANVKAASRWQRVADGVLAQLHWMVPAPDQPVRAGKLAELVAQLVRQLPRAAAGTRVAPPELVHAASQTRDVAALAAAWLDGRDWSAAPLRKWRA